MHRQKEASDQLTFRIPCSVANSTEISLCELSRYVGQPMAEPSFHIRCTIPAGAVNIKHLK